MPRMRSRDAGRGALYLCESVCSVCYDGSGHGDRNLEPAQRGEELVEVEGLGQQVAHQWLIPRGDLLRQTRVVEAASTGIWLSSSSSSIRSSSICASRRRGMPAGRLAGESEEADRLRRLRDSGEQPCRFDATARAVAQYEELPCEMARARPRRTGEVSTRFRRRPEEPGTHPGALPSATSVVA
jgi:hypothetical protein